VVEKQAHLRAGTGEGARAIEPFARQFRLPLSIGILPRVEVTIPANEAEVVRASFLERVDSVAHRALIWAVHSERLPWISLANDCVTLLPREKTVQRYDTGDTSAEPSAR
jgi:hypothetical protein